MVEVLMIIANIVELSTIPGYAASMATTSSATSVRWLTEREQRAWRAYITGSRRLVEHLDLDLKAQGLTHDDYGVLVALSEAEGGRLRMSELADLSVESRSRLSHHVGRLEARGLVARETCPEDRRGSFAVLTADGRATIEAVAPHHVEGVRRYLLDLLTPDELDVIGEAFARIERHLSSGDARTCPGTGGPTAPEA